MRTQGMLSVMDVGRRCGPKRLTRCYSECQAVLQGHTSLVGQLQMRGGTLVTGGSDGSVRVWSLEKFCPIHRLAAHDNSVTSLQFDDTRVVSGGSDGRVKVWDLKTGHLVRELVAQGEAVWRVAFEDEKCVAMALRNNQTIMEVRYERARIGNSAVRLTRISGLVLLASGRSSVRAPAVARRAEPADERPATGLQATARSTGLVSARRCPGR